jgi:hypothetical protein
MSAVAPISSGPSTTDWLTAIGTVGATVVALLLAGREQLRGFFFRPRLEVSVRLGPPDCHVIQEVQEVEWPGHGSTFDTEPVFYCRLAVNNVGNRRASQVAVRMTRLWRQAEPGGYVEDADFLPMNMTWAHIREGLVVPVLDPGLPRHCNLCHFYQPAEGATGPPLIQFDTEVVPFEVGENRWPTKKPPGDYRAEIAVTADNAEPIRRVLEIRFTGEWFIDAETIAERSLRVTVTKP